MINGQADLPVRSVRQRVMVDGQADLPVGSVRQRVMVGAGRPNRVRVHRMMAVNPHRMLKMSRFIRIFKKSVNISKLF